MTSFSPMAFANVLVSTAPRRWRVQATVALPLMVAILLAMVGAFGTYVSMGLPLRLLHFVSVGLAIAGISAALSWLARRYWFDSELPFWAMLSIALITMPPGAGIVWQGLALWAPWTLRYVTYRDLIGQVLALNIVIGSLMWLLQQRLARPATATDAEPARAPSDHGFRARLPAPLRHAAILALSAEDHYVRVRTDRGDALILMNFTTAMDALGPTAGVRIHRSHWVSRRLADIAMAHGSRQGICVDDNTVLPVSRAGRKSLQDFFAQGPQLL
ncbi:MAG: LytTR family DNA-binding domain-containing protein [Tardiphaga sp.]